MIHNRVSQQSGFTLVELIIALLVVAVIVGFGVPSFQNMARNSEMTTRTNSIIAALQVARAEAVRRGRPVSVCPSNDAQNCVAGGNWAEGWIVFVDANSNGAAAISEILRVEEGSSQVTTNAGPDFIRFMGNGLRDTSVVNTAQEIALRRPDCGAGDGRRVAISPAGRVNVTSEDC